MGLNKRYWLAQTQWIVFPPSPALAETENHHKCHWCPVAALPLRTFPLLLTQKSFEGFYLQGEAIASMVKMWQKLCIWGETDELLENHMHCRAVSEPNGFSDTVRIILYFFTRQYWGWKCDSRSEQAQSSAAHRDGTDLLFQPRTALPQTLPSVVIFMQHYLHLFDITCLESCHQLAHTPRHCVPRLGTQMTVEWRKLPACTPGLLLDPEGLQTPQPHPREWDFLPKHPCVELLLINTPKQLLSTSLEPYACYIHKPTFPLKIFKLKLLINPLRWSRWIRQLTIRTPFC